MDWRYKATFQLFLSFLPWGEKINHQFQKLRGGKDHVSIDGGLADGLKMFKALDKAGVGSVRDKTLVEVGTGWLPVIPLLCAGLGAKKIHTYDHVAHVRTSLVKDVLRQLKEKARIDSELQGIFTDPVIESAENDGPDDPWSLLHLFHVDYKAPADASKTGMEAETADIFFSNKVLEHIPEQAIVSICREAYRVLKPGGIFYNYIGMLDHYSYFDKKISRVNCLRYSDLFWKIMAQNKISYQNRLRKSSYVNIISTAGFDIIKTETIVPEEDLETVKQMKLAYRFQKMEPEDLAASFVEIIARKPQGGSLCS
jgi:SAM-dependent methyltransferase